MNLHAITASTVEVYKGVDLISEHRLRMGGLLFRFPNVQDQILRVLSPEA